MRLKGLAQRVLSLGGPVFSLAMIGLGIETLLCARYSGYDKDFGAPYKVIPIIPFLPEIAWLACVFGAVLAASGFALLWKRAVRPAAIAVGILMFFGAVLLDAPKYAAHTGNMAVRTAVFEPLALAALAWLLPDFEGLPKGLTLVSRYLLAVSYIVFGVDHFLALVPIGTLVPNWIPWHVFWVAFFGAGFIAAGMSIVLDVLVRYAGAGIGLMYAIWVFTLHAPRVARDPHNPDEWSSFLIAVALWGGSWALAARYPEHVAREAETGE